MTPAAADWVATHVLPPRYLTSCGGIDLIRKCACHYGLCGHCGRRDKHSDCPRWTDRMDGNSSPETHVVTSGGWGRTRVWLSGTPCRWVCPCPCVPPAPAPAVVPPAEQLTLFALAGGVR